MNSESPIWNDSFWEDANIPQLDGTFDDDRKFDIELVLSIYLLLIIP